MPNDCLKCFNSFIVTGKRSLKESLEGHYEMEVGGGSPNSQIQIEFLD